MKKLLWKFLMWDHLCQAILVVSTIPGILKWIEGSATTLNGFLIGFNLGAACYWQFYLAARASRDRWMERAMRPTEKEVREFVNIAKRLVDARIQSSHIEPGKN